MAALRSVAMTSTSKALEETVAKSAPGMASDFNAKIIEEFRANEGNVKGPIGGHPANSYPPHRRQVRDRARLAAGLLPTGQRPLRDRRVQRRIASPPRLVLQPQGQPQDLRRGGYPDLHRTNG